MENEEQNAGLFLPANLKRYRGQEGIMTSIERERLAVLAKEAAALQKVWLREREEQRAMQVAANERIRRLWLESDLLQSKTSQVISAA